MANQNNASQDQFWSLLAKKLSKQATPEELQELQRILLSNSDLHHHSEMISDMWQQEIKKINEGTEAAYMRHVMKHKDEFFTEQSEEKAGAVEPIVETKTSSGLFTKKKLIVFSVSIFMALAAGTAYLLTIKKNSEPAQQAISSVVTKNGNRTKIVLPDGSQVWLNAGSNLDYNNLSFNKELREVSLNGEAYFDVVKNAEKPFIIHTKKMDIKVLGTAFNVRSYSNEKVAEASLIRGRIQVFLKDRKDQPITLEPNEKISIATEDHEQLAKKPGKTIAAKNEEVIPQIVINELKPSPKYDVIPEIAWTQSRLLFEDETLENIALKLERWFGKKVTIKNESLKDQHYYGNFGNQTLEEVLSYLKLSRPFNFRIENDSVTIY